MRKLIVVGIAVAVVGMAALVYALYVLVAEGNAALLWVLSVVLSFAVGAVVGWLAGRYEVSALLRGVDLGANKVVTVAERIATVKERKAADVGEPVIDAALLPPTVYRELPGGESGTVDL